MSAEKSGKPINAFTVDLEDWFQGLTSTNSLVARWHQFESRVVGATDNLLQLLSAYNVRATFFVLGHVADRHPELVARVADGGHEIGIHGYYHRFVSRLRPDEFAREVEQSIVAVERITGQRPLGHRAPYFSINASTLWAFDVLTAHGLRYDSSVFPTRNMLYGFPDAPRFPFRLANGLTEFPATTLRLLGCNWPIAGGFYHRALPSALIRAGIRRINGQGQPAILYIHPWELDTGQTYARVTLRERLTHYHGRRGLEKKLRRLLTEFEFTPLCELMQRMEPAPSALADALHARAEA